MIGEKAQYHLKYGMQMTPGRFLNTKSILSSIRGAALPIWFVLCYLLSLLLSSCGSDAPDPAPSQPSQNLERSSPLSNKAAPAQKGAGAATAPVPSGTSIFSSTAGQDAKPPAEPPDPEALERAQLQEAVDKLFTEPDPEIRQIVLNSIKPALENDPQANERFQKLQKEKGISLDFEKGPSKEKLNSVMEYPPAGDTGD